MTQVVQVRTKESSRQKPTVDVPQLPKSKENTTRVYDYCISIIICDNLTDG